MDLTRTLVYSAVVAWKGELGSHNLLASPSLSIQEYFMNKL
jgi:hypothetical protein